MQEHKSSLAATGENLTVLRRWVETSLTAPLMTMYFLMLLMNTLLRDTKDTLLVTSQAGVESIPILKSWAVIPFSFLYFLLYYKLTTILGDRSLFIVILTMFSAFYFVFALLLYPRQYVLTPVAFSEALGKHLPENALPLQHLVENWLLGLFYCVSELYASAVCQFMFWQVANSVVSVDQAKSMYPLIGAMGNLGMVIAGYLLQFFANYRDWFVAEGHIRQSAQNGGHSPARNSVPFGPVMEGQVVVMHTVDSTPLDGDSRGSILSDLVAPFAGSSMEPADQAWQLTLLGISSLLLVCNILIVFLYDCVHRRKEHLETVTGPDSSVTVSVVESSEVKETVLSSIGLVETIGSAPLNPVKRRTGSGNYVGANSVHHVGLDSSGPVKRFPQSDSYWDGNSYSNVDSGHLHGNSTGSTFVGPTLRRDSEGSLKKNKVKLSLIEGLKTLSKSIPLRCAATLVVSYGVSISLVEVSWKGQVKKALESPNDYSRFMGMFWTLTGLVSMSFMLIGRVVLQKIGYAPAVLFTPASMAIAGSLFFIVSILQDLSGISTVKNGDIAWPAYFGGAAVLFAKSAKYAFFDATKEIIFIPLDDHSKNLGKAAIDVVAYRLSKSGGSFFLQFVILIFGSVSSTAGIVPISIFYGIIVFAWIHAALLASKFISHTSGHDDIPEQHVV